MNDPSLPHLLLTFLFHFFLLGLVFSFCLLPVFVFVCVLIPVRRLLLPLLVHLRRLEPAEVRAMFDFRPFSVIDPSHEERSVGSPPPSIPTPRSEYSRVTFRKMLNCASAKGVTSPEELLKEKNTHRYKGGVCFHSYTVVVDILFSYMEMRSCVRPKLIHHLGLLTCVYQIITGARVGAPFVPLGASEEYLNHLCYCKKIKTVAALT